MNKITSEHLNKKAYVYIRQSTREQVKKNIESQRLQYSLKTKAMEMGYKEVVVIDNDLGKSGEGGVIRAGFEELLSEVCQGKVGAIFSIEASRLARNGKEWHTLLELCSIFNTVLVDFESIYDPKLPNDRLLLGMKGITSEMEITVFRQRSQAALNQKAKRGELFTSVGIGYVRITKDKIDIDPDKRIQEAIALIFKQFKSLLSIRQVMIWFHQEKIELPAVCYGKEGRKIIWKLPVYSTIWHILTNPIYAGAYSFGKTFTKITYKDGRKHKSTGLPRKKDEWAILIKDHHKEYIKWDEYEYNQKIIRDNANMKGTMVRGSVKDGNGLLAGLLRCGHCGRKLQTVYSRKKGNGVRYSCRGTLLMHNGTERCISFGSLRINEAVSCEVIKLLSPVGIESAIKAVDEIEANSYEMIRQKELALEQAGYEVERAKKQFNLVDPENRLVAASLEKRWNDTLEVFRNLENELMELNENRESLSEKDKNEILSLGENLQSVWDHEMSDIKIKKQILRTVIKEIIVSVEDERLKLIIHWEGGDHTELYVKKNKTGMHRWSADIEIKQTIQGLSRVINDKRIASLLNRLGKKTGKGNSWTQLRVRSFRNTHNIPVFKKEELAARGEIYANEAANKLKISIKKIYKMIHEKVLPANQVCFGAPWIISEKDLEKKEVVYYCDNGMVDDCPLPYDQPDLFPFNTKT